MEFLSDVLHWIGKHQPVMPFPLILPIVGAWWASMAARWAFSRPGSEEEDRTNLVTFGGLGVAGAVAIAGLVTGHWYFLVPLVAGAVAGFAGAVSVKLLSALDASIIVTDVDGYGVERVVSGPPDAKNILKKCERIVNEYRKTVPVDLLTTEAWERADAKLRALREMFALLERLEQTDKLEHKEFSALVAEADALFRDVPLEKSLVERYRAARVELGPTIRSVKLAIESLYLSILNLPSEARSRVIDEVPLEYRRLLDPADHASDEGTAPVITIPERPEPPRTPKRPRLAA